MAEITRLSTIGVQEPVIRPGKLGACGGCNPKGESFGFTSYYMTRNEKPFIPLVAEFHFSRFSYLHWEEELLKMKAGGVRIVSTYVFWNHHEEEEGVFDWSLNRNLRHFIDLCAKLEMPLILRIGPFCHGEMRNGGIPDWVFAKPLEIRSNDPAYLALAKRLYREIAKQMKGCLYQEGGPVIAVQLENEYMHCGAPHDAWGYKTGKFLSKGAEGNAHMAELRKLAEEAGIRPLFFTATAWGGAAVPEEGFLPMLAGYAYASWLPDQPPSREFIYRDLHAVPAEPVPFDTRDYPVAYCEMAGGMQASYNARPVVPADSIEAMTLVKLASGSNLLGYYMYHGGSNPVGKKGFLNEQFLPKITYDYQSPLGEFGRVGESYDRIRTLSLFLEAFGELLAPMATLLPDGQADIAPDNTGLLRWCVRQKDGSGFVFLNNFQDQVDMPKRPFRIELDTSQGHVSFPISGEAVMPANRGAVLPFNLELHGVSLVSATAQLLTELKCGEEHTVVFFAHEELTPEYVLQKSSVGKPDVGEGTVAESESGDLWIIRPVAGKEHQVTLHTAKGQTVRLITLTREEALQSYRFRLWGQDTLAIADCRLMVHNERLMCTSPERHKFQVSLLPEPRTGISADQGAGLTLKQQGPFSTYIIAVPSYEARISVQQSSAASALIGVAMDWPDQVEDVWLHMEYEGDVAAAYLDGKLLTDHFQYGLPWEIGLKAFRSELQDHSLHVAITPLRKGTVHTIINQAQVERFEGVEIGRFRRIEAIPHYRVSLSLSY